MVILLIYVSRSIFLSHFFRSIACGGSSMRVYI
ncbi:hypothetical protein LINPERHAP2_LOCUS33198 [Linum perenne]